MFLLRNLGGRQGPPLTIRLKTRPFLYSDKQDPYIFMSLPWSLSKNLVIQIGRNRGDYYGCGSNNGSISFKFPKTAESGTALSVHCQ